MEDIYLIPIRLKPLNFTIQNIYLKDIYYIYPKEYEEKMCGNDVNRNNDCIFSWLWKQQGRKR